VLVLDVRFASLCGSPALRDPLERIVSAWRPDKAVERARTAYEYVARILPTDAYLEAVGAADRVVLEAEERQDLPAYEEALRELCRTARAEAMREKEGAA